MIKRLNEATWSLFVFFKFCFFFPPRSPSLSRALGPQRSDDALDVFLRNLGKNTTKPHTITFIHTDAAAAH